MLSPDSVRNEFSAVVLEKTHTGLTFRKLVGIRYSLIPQIEQRRTHVQRGEGDMFVLIRRCAP